MPPSLPLERCRRKRGPARRMLQVRTTARIAPSFFNSGPPGSRTGRGSPSDQLQHNRHCLRQGRLGRLWNRVRSIVPQVSASTTATMAKTPMPAKRNVARGPGVAAIRPPRTIPDPGHRRSDRLQHAHHPRLHACAVSSCTALIDGHPLHAVACPPDDRRRAGDRQGWGARRARGSRRRPRWC